MADRPQLLTLLNRMRNVRRFRPEPVPDDAVADVLEAARWSGSAMNRQPWELVVVREPNLLQALAATSPSIGWVVEAPLAIVPVMAGDAADEEGFDEGRLSERMLLAARANGLGAGLGWFPPGTPRVEALALLGVPPGRTVRTIVALGFAAEDRSGGGGNRKPLRDLVFAERYGQRPS